MSSIKSFAKTLGSFLVAFAFSKVAFAQSFDIEKDFLQAAKTQANFNRGNGSDYRYNSLGELTKKNLLPGDKHTAVIPEYVEGKGLKFNFYYDDVALKQPRFLLLDLLFWVSLESPFVNLSYNSPIQGHIDYGAFDTLRESHLMAELINNALEGSPVAKANLLDIKAQAISSMHFPPEIIAKLGLPANIQEEMMSELEKEADAQTKVAKKYLRDKNAELAAWKEQHHLQDRVEDLPQKLNDFVLKNDRKSVRNLLEIYLPWPIMEPAEVSMWKTWLEAIEHPNTKDTLIGFRGVDYETDKVQRLQTAQGEKLGFFSSVLTKNQGSYTRRLRSLATNRLKNGNTKMHSGLPNVSVMHQFLSHAEDPVASNFLSFSFDYPVIEDFVGADKADPKTGERIPGGGVLVVKMDRRRMIPNVPSHLPHESEVLVPLIIFPDEIVVYHEGPIERDDLQRFSDLLDAKLGVGYESGQGTQAQYRDLAARFLSETSPKGFRCSNVFK